MLPVKVKVVLGSVLGLLVFAVAGAAFQAGSGPVGGKEKGRPLTEVEALRKENELLKVNLQVVLEKVQAQEAQLRVLRGKAEGGKVHVWDPRTGKALEVKPDGKSAESFARWAEAVRVYEDALARQRSEIEKLKAQELAEKERAAQAFQKARDEAYRQRAMTEKRRAEEPLDEVKKALKDLQEAKAKEQRQRAIEALEKALQKMKEQEGPLKKPT
jgi:hypothetical protein